MSDRGVQRLLAQRAGVYRWPARMSLARLSATANAAGWRSVAISGRGIASKHDFLAALAQALQFPAYFGYNWDALEECLADLPRAPGYLLMLSGMRAFAEQSPSDWLLAHTILAAAAADWAERGVPFIVLVRGPGGTEPLWHPDLQP